MLRTAAEMLHFAYYTLYILICCDSIQPPQTKIKKVCSQSADILVSTAVKLILYHRPGHTEALQGLLRGLLQPLCLVLVTWLVTRQIEPLQGCF